MRVVRQSQEAESDTGQTRHQARRIDVQRRAAQPFSFLDALDDGSCQQRRCGNPSLVSESVFGLKQQLEVSEVAMTERVVLTEPAANCGAQRRIDLVADNGV